MRLILLAKLFVGVFMLSMGYLHGASLWAVGGLFLVFGSLLGCAIYRLIRPPDWL